MTINSIVGVVGLQFKRSVTPGKKTPPPGGGHSGGVFVDLPTTLTNLVGTDRLTLKPSFEELHCAFLPDSSCRTAL